MTNIARSADSPSRVLVAAAFAAIYLIWGSTYLAIRIGLETLPPFLMGALRFLTAGTVLFGWARLRGQPPPAGRQWLGGALVGVLLLCVGNGCVLWAQQRVASGMAALLVTTVPMWMVLVDWLRPGGVRPARSVVLGLIIGFAGVTLLIRPTGLSDGVGVHAVGAAALMLGSMSWSVGSVYARFLPMPKSPMSATAVQMLAGGVGLLAVGTAAGEWRLLAAADASARSVLAVAYLCVFGSLVAFSAYVWLLRVSTPAKVATYAYVNPVVAVLLGWAVANENVSTATALAAGIIVASVVIITRYRVPVPVSRVEADEPAPSTESATSAAAPHVGLSDEPGGALPAPKACGSCCGS